MKTLSTIIAEINGSIENKDEAGFTTSVNELVNVVGSELDQYSKTAFVKAFSNEYKGKKGRVASPFTPEKVSNGTGKRGRPALTNEQKADKLKAKFEAEMAALQGSHDEEVSA